MKAAQTKEEIAIFEAEVLDFCRPPQQTILFHNDVLKSLIGCIREIRLDLFKLSSGLAANIKTRETLLDFQRARIEHQNSKCGKLGFEAQQDQERLPQAEAEFGQAKAWHSAISRLFEHFNDTLPFHEPQHFQKVECSNGRTGNLFSEEIVDRYPNPSSLGKHVLIGLAGFLRRPEAIEDLAVLTHTVSPPVGIIDNTSFTEIFANMFIELQNLESLIATLRGNFEKDMPNIADALAQGFRFFAALERPGSVSGLSPNGSVLTARP